MMKKYILLLLLLFVIPVAYSVTDADLEANLVAYFKMDEAPGSTTAVDTVFASELNEVSGVTADFVSAGLLSNAYNYSTAASKFIINGTLPRLPSGTNTRTMCYWIYVSSWDGEHWPFLQGTADNNAGWTMRFEATNKIRASCRSDDVLTTGGEFYISQWNFICFGLYVGGDTYTVWTNNTLIMNSTGHACNTPNSNFGFSSSLEGGGDVVRIDNVMMFNRSLGTAEVDYLYNNGAGRTLVGVVADNAPTINYTVPANNSRTNADPVLFTLNVTDDHASTMYCELRNTSTLLDSDNFSKDVYNSFSYDVLFNWESESILYNITCNDNNSNKVSMYLNLTIDTLNPVLTINFPTTATLNKKVTNLTIDIDGTDKSLYLLNYTLWNSSGIIQSVQNSTPASGGAGQILNITKVIDISNYGVGNYHINVSISDPHTYGSLRNLTYNYSPDGTITFFKEVDNLKTLGVEFGYFAGGSAHKITSTQISNYNIDYFVVEKSKEYKFGMLFDMPDADFRMAFRIPTSDLVLYDSDTAHFIWRNEYYIDFDASVCEYAGGGWSGRSNCRTGIPTWYEDGNYIYVYYDYDLRNWYNPGDRLVFYTESIGGLNIVEQVVSFSISNSTAVNNTYTGTFMTNVPYYTCTVETINNSYGCIAKNVLNAYNVSIFIGANIATPEIMYDGDYSTCPSYPGDSSVFQLYANYTSPIQLLTSGTSVNITFSTGRYNTAVPDVCIGNNIQMIYNITFESTINQIRLHCYNYSNSSFNTFYNNPSAAKGGLCEESITFKIPVNFTACGGIANSTAINFSIQDELTSSYISSDYDMQVNFYTSTSANIGHYYTTATGTDNGKYCIYPPAANITADINLHYSATDYNERDWIVTAYNLDNYTNPITLYLLSTSNSTLVTFIVTDASNDYYEGITIEAESYDIGTGTYTLVDTKTTNSQGQAVMSLVLYTTYYRFTFYDGATMVRQTGNGLLTSTTQYFRIVTADPTLLERYLNVNQIVTTLSYSNTSKLITYSWTDFPSAISNICANITVGNGTSFFSNCSSISNSLFTYTLPNLNDTFFFRGFAIDTEGYTWTLDTRGFDLRSPWSRIWGQEGLAIALIIFLSFGLIMLKSPISGIIGGAVSFIFIYLFGLIPISLQAVFGVVFGSFTLIVLMNRRDR